jgi:CRISPR/Cas system-associated exonuclease Cas4 (RecB family)
VPKQPKPKPANQSWRVIRASEIGQYKYCARAWWLGSIKGVPSTNTRELAQGDVAHERHGRAVWSASALQVLAVALAVIAVVVLLLAFVR